MSYMCIFALMCRGVLRRVGLAAHGAQRQSRGATRRARPDPDHVKSTYLRLRPYFFVNICSISSNML